MLGFGKFIVFSSFQEDGDVTAKHNDQINVLNIIKVFVEGARGIRLVCDT